jgi:hypothetical protein
VPFFYHTQTIYHDNPGESYLKEEVNCVLAIIELKYKRNGSITPFERDVLKVKQYIDTPPFYQTQYYLAFIHEAEYETAIGDSWLTLEQQRWAKGKVTELSSHYIEGNNEMVWQVLSHNNLNPNHSPQNRLSRHDLKMGQ